MWPEWFRMPPERHFGGPTLEAGTGVAGARLDGIPVGPAASQQPANRRSEEVGFPSLSVRATVRDGRRSHARRSGLAFRRLCGPRGHADVKALHTRPCPHAERRDTMGDKGGKKDKDKSQKQEEQKRRDKAKAKQDKQRPATA